MTRAATYARVSKSDGSQDPENQLRDLRAAFPGAVEYVDRETGTGRRHRPEYERMLRDAEAKRFDVLGIWALDRLGREGVLKTLLDLHRLERAGVRVRSLRETWFDPSSPVYGLLVSVFAWVAEQEAKRIRERVKAGLDLAKSRGVKLGRRQVPIDPQRLQALHAAGRSIREIARQLGAKPSTVYKRARELGLVFKGLRASG